MNTDSAVIYSPVKAYTFDKKICGLYPLERNIRVLHKVGIKKILLNLSDREYTFYNKKVEKHIRSLRDIEIIQSKGKPKKSGFLSIPSNLFMQFHYFNKFETYFIKEKKGPFVPIISKSIFYLITDKDFKKAVDCARDTILENTGGFISRKLNKSISIPISLLLARTRIHPNLLTLFNLSIGIFSAYFLIQNTYWEMVLGGFFFQLASIFDGVDGEVAKFTIKFSKLGGWLDTFVDNTTLVLFLAGISYLFSLQVSGYWAIGVVSVMFLGLITMVFAMIAYLKRHSDSASLVTYEKEFLEKLPRSDRLVSFILKMKYMTKKELFALVLFLLCFTGKIYLTIPGMAFVLFFGAISLLIINKRYLGKV